MSENLLEIKNLSVEFHTPEGITRAVNDVSFNIPKGKTVGLVGESGSGKSVTSFSIMKLIPNPPGKIVNGQILFEGQDLVQFSEEQMRKIRGNQISMIFQEPMTSLNPVFKAGDQIAEVLRIHKNMSPKEAMEKTLFLMDQVGIPKPSQKYHAYPHEMSGGQKQRIMIAMAMACEPKLLIADEPTTALDVTIQKQVLELMFDLQQKYNMSMLFITHDLSVIADIADEVAVMYRSNLVEFDHCNKIFATPQHAYTKGLLACRPNLDKNPCRLLTVEDFIKDGVEIESPKVYDDKTEKDLSSEETLLEVQNLKTYFPVKGGFWGRVIDNVKAVDDVSIKIKKGETLGLVGESGCGKTTLGRSILRLNPLKSGNILYKGQDITQFSKKEMRDLRKKMQIIFQDPYSSLNPRMTIADILREPMKIHNIGANKQERIDRCKWLLEKVGLNSQALNRYPHEFSGGQRQRISIARALAIQPEFIICDESVSALDVSVQAQVLNLLLDLQDEFKLTYIFISHDLSVVNFISDNVGVMYAGKIVEYNTAHNIYHNPQEEYTKTLLSAIPKGVPKDFLTV